MRRAVSLTLPSLPKTMAVVLKSGLEHRFRHQPRGFRAGSRGRLQGLSRQPGPADDTRQAGVMAGHAGEKGQGLVNCRTLVPAKRIEDDFAVLRWEREVSEDPRHKTKNVMSFQMINEMFAAGLFDRQ
jgi:hypothetical protein